jgi:hypothetical protein
MTEYVSPDKSQLSFFRQGVADLAGEMVVRRSATLLEAEVDGELVALHVESGTCFGYNQSATRIWTLIEEPATVGDIRAALLQEYEIDAETCRIEVDALLKQLQEDGLVTLEPAA